jgi:hypothetical protein
MRGRIDRQEDNGALEPIRLAVTSPRSLPTRRRFTSGVEVAYAPIGRANVMTNGVSDPTPEGGGLQEPRC